MERAVTLTATTSAASQTINIADIGTDWTIRWWVEGVDNQKALLAIETSTDNFVSDSQTIAVLDSTNIGVRLESTLRAYERPSSRVGVSNAKMRLAVQSITGGSITGRLAIAF